MRSIEQIRPRKKNSIGSRLTHARLKLGWSQQEVADLALVHRSQINNIEMSRSMPSVDLLTYLCRAYRVSADWVLFGKKR